MAIPTKPEYLHVILNPLPIYGLAMGMLAQVVALFLKSRPAQVAALVVVFVSAVSIAPVTYFGEKGFDRVVAVSDDAGEAWLEEHRERAELAEPIFYTLAVLSLAALLVPLRFPKSSVRLAVATLVLSAIALAVAGRAAYAGGHVRHTEFRFEPAPAVREE